HREHHISLCVSVQFMPRSSQNLTHQIRSAGKMPKAVFEYSFRALEPLECPMVCSNLQCEIDHFGNTFKIGFRGGQNQTFFSRALRCDRIRCIAETLQARSTMVAIALDFAFSGKNWRQPKPRIVVLRSKFDHFSKVSRRLCEAAMLRIHEA